MTPNENHDLDPRDAAAEAVEPTVEPADEAKASAEESASATSESEPPDSERKTPPPPPPDPREQRIRALEHALAEREATLHTYIRAHKKAEQEFEAFKTRMQRDQQRELLAAKGRIVEKMLDVDENLERTITATAQTASVETLLEGLRLVHRLFLERLTELGLERVDPIGQPFDPTTMEALGVVPVTDPAQDDRVVMTMRAGFRIGDHEVRPALVQVGRKI